MRHCRVGDHCWYICRNLCCTELRLGTENKGKSALTYDIRATASGLVTYRLATLSTVFTVGAGLAARSTA